MLVGCRECAHVIRLRADLRLRRRHPASGLRFGNLGDAGSGRCRLWGGRRTILWVEKYGPNDCYKNADNGISFLSHTKPQTKSSLAQRTGNVNLLNGKPALCDRCADQHFSRDKSRPQQASTRTSEAASVAGRHSKSLTACIVRRPAPRTS